MIKIPTKLFTLPEFYQLEQLASSNRQARTAQLLWLNLVCVAGQAQAAGDVTASDGKALTDIDYARLAKVSRSDYARQLLTLLVQADLLRCHRDGRYQISHWERYVVTPTVTNGASSPVTSQQPAGPTVPTAPATLQQYTPEQRTQLVAVTDEILAYLQQQSGKQFSNEPPTQQLLANLFAQKVTVKQIKRVIDWKCKDWYGGDFWKFVRPQTLFGPKFTQYLLEAPPEPTARPAAGPTRHQYLRDLFEMSCGDIETILWRAADEKVAVTRAEVEAIGRELGH
ncbi:conserved phage C-terminal domain-containing protein [Loigolactobacillus binensis]|uniref:Conserved phage C-terminal domain-containing protein n=1 Tax=Loigolactobacillus binensis TaxID=2559922 RepID=A0ABW3E7V0_9LACO|nr:conserved phage C-terminal domain-containing protein [Loigolactobacillus binensis]